MDELVEAFGKLLGRAPTEEEKQRLARTKEALGLSNNDALWLVVMAWESYDERFREIPAKIGAETQKALEGVRATVTALAKGETEKAHRALAELVARSAGKLAAQRVDASRLMMAAVAGGVLVLFGGLCMVVGFGMGTGRVPFWAAEGTTSLGRLAGAALRAPAGWMAFLLALPVAAYAGRWGWASARDPGAPGSDRMVGWVMVATALLGAVAALVVLLRVV